MLHLANHSGYYEGAMNPNFPFSRVVNRRDFVSVQPRGEQGVICLRV